MAKPDNYAIQAQDAKNRFLTYDQEKIIEKFHLQADADYLYPVMLGCTYRLCRKTGNLERKEGEVWVDANTFGQVMTLLDMLCDAKENRYLAGRYKQQQHFGLMFHQNFAEDTKNPLALAFDEDEAALRQACHALGGEDFPGGDYGCMIERFDGLCIGLLFWHGDEEFAPRQRTFWDENALQWIRYETMYYVVGLLAQRLMRTLDEIR
jgi:hypothetical protein